MVYQWLTWGRAGNVDPSRVKQLPYHLNCVIYKRVLYPFLPGSFTDPLVACIVFYRVNEGLT